MNGITSTSAHKTRPVAKTQNSVPWFWPVELLSAVTEEEFKAFRRGFDTVAEAVKLDTELTPKFATRSAANLARLAPLV